MELAIVAALGWVITTYLFIKRDGEKDRSHQLVIAGLLNRIQAPEATVAQALVPDGEFDAVTLPHTEESYWEDLKHIEVSA